MRNVANTCTVGLGLAALLVAAATAPAAAQKAAPPRVAEPGDRTTRNDFSLANDLAAENSEKLKEVQALFLNEAVKYSVLPIDDRFTGRIHKITIEVK
jgi:hypothetical protein